ncbi:hypothetical protein [Streptomyces scabiei]|uniref:hypothetical protein n=1 Tax=Streptomyces scabiei TaxID=1930 RepID=UPI0029B5E137|nr:hypothetical protein [Streptomyces scabiei]MDX2538584.1 hypothetical protein [Streptomyces scabiei]MDX2799858.1 hypothetical protein [Streptomyces scabiei]MDX2855539.1 hypothetical protein [Streptomyces scabiei]MDX3278063.1 hypothetical protein [Streptomyces scabiei]MDX3828513.1 hypothetical protein [Streptomyces scabiei]
MSWPELDWGDVEQAAALWLRGRHTGVRVVNELPADLEKKLPLVQVQVTPGGGEDGTTGVTLLDVETFAATRTGMWDLARAVHTSMLALAGEYADGLVIDTVSTDARPAPVPYGNPALRRAVATYRLTSRAQAPA